MFGFPPVVFACLNTCYEFSFALHLYPSLDSGPPLPPPRVPWLVGCTAHACSGTRSSCSGGQRSRTATPTPLSVTTGHALTSDSARSWGGTTSEQSSNWHFISKTIDILFLRFVVAVHCPTSRPLDRPIVHTFRN